VKKLLKRLHASWDNSLVGYFSKRAKEKWFTPIKDPIRQVNYHGVILNIENLPTGMQEKIIKGLYEVKEVKILPNLISSEDKVLEIGGAVGFLSLYCKKILGVKELVTIEANPKTAEYFLKNYKINNTIPNLIQVALAPEDGEIEFHVSPMFWEDSLILNINKEGKEVIKVNGIRFENLIKKCGIIPTALIIDIEGAEQYINTDQIPATVKKILIEIHPKIIGARKAFSFLENLIIKGFVVEAYCEHVWALRR